VCHGFWHPPAPETNVRNWPVCHQLKKLSSVQHVTILPQVKSDASTASVCCQFPRLTSHLCWLPFRSNCYTFSSFWFIALQ